LPKSLLTSLRIFPGVFLVVSIELGSNSHDTLMDTEERSIARLYKSGRNPRRFTARSECCSLFTLKTGLTAAAINVPSNRDSDQWILFAAEEPICWRSKAVLLGHDDIGSCVISSK
jgi:hypothetical protein